MDQQLIPFYDPTISYEDNYQQGPFGDFTISPGGLPANIKNKFLDFPVRLPFGIPAGPLLNARFIKAAFAYGFDLCVYKTVRSCFRKSHELPNVLAIHPDSYLSNTKETVLANNHYTQPLSITNSFGVPSFSPEIWQPDMAEAVQSAQAGQLLIASFQGTSGERDIISDYAYTASLVAQTGAKVIEANLSCPNEGSHRLLCFDVDSVEKIVIGIKEKTDIPLILKLAYFENETLLRTLVQRVGHLVAGFSTINTISAKPVDMNGQPALGGRVESGVCGDAIRWAGVDMVSRLNQLRREESLSFSIIGVGGISSKEHYQQFLSAGANAAMSATGAMWNSHLALDILFK